LVLFSHPQVGQHLAFIVSPQLERVKFELSKMRGGR
jgi:hypothetical protein